MDSTLKFSGRPALLLSALSRAALALILAAVASGCATPWVWTHAMGPLPDRFDDIQNVTSARLQGDQLIIELDAALARSYRSLNNYRPPRKTGAAWLELNTAWLNPESPNLIPRRDLHEGEAAPVGDPESWERIPVIDLRRYRVPEREARLKRVAQRYEKAVVMFAPSDEMAGLYNTFLLIVEQRPGEGVVHVHRIEPEAVPTKPNKWLLPLLPFAAAYDVVIAFPASVILTLFSSANVWVVY